MSHEKVMGIFFFPLLFDRENENKSSGVLLKYTL